MIPDDEAYPGLLTGRIALDANALDRDGTDRDALVDRFRTLMQDGLIDVVVTEGVGRELRHPHAPGQVRAQTDRTLRPPGTAPTASQHIARIKVRAILRGDAAGDRHAADAGHLCDAAEAGCAFFLTQDKRFSRKRRDLAAALPLIRVLGLREFFDLYDAARTPDEE